MMTKGQRDILYLADFPPSNLNGGSIIFSRLFRKDWEDRILFLVSSVYMKVAAKDSRLNAPHLVFYLTNSTGPWGMGRIKAAFNLLLLPFLFAFAWLVMVNRKVKIIFSVAHGNFFIVASLLALLTDRPLLVWVHDDWPRLQAQSSLFLEKMYRLLWGFLLRRASKVLAVSFSMQEFLSQHYGIKAEIQLPPAERPRQTKADMFHTECPRIVYVGNVGGLVWDSLELLINLLASGMLEREYGLRCQLYLYTDIAASCLNRIETTEAIKIFPWRTQEMLQEALSEADILFLPYSFSLAEKTMATTSLPTKLADYLAAQKVILAVAPPYSGLAKYIQSYGFAALVKQYSAEVLAEMLVKIVRQEDYRCQLKKRAEEAFFLYHDLEKAKKQLFELVKELSGAKG